MHKIFGQKENVKYVDREGAYLIPIRDNQVGIIKTPKGFFFIGGGIENDESHMECIKRECLEETGYNVSIKDKICSAETYCTHETIGYFHPIQTYYKGELISQISKPKENDHEFLWIQFNDIKGKMFTKMQNWALEQCINTTLTSTHNMKLNPVPFNMIANGQKTIELRLFDEKRKNIKIGDTIIFTNIKTSETLNVKVINLYKFNNFDELYKNLPLLKCGYTKENINEASPDDMNKYYSKKEQEKFGVLGIEICQQNH